MKVNHDKFMEYISFKVRKSELIRQYGSATLWSQMDVDEEIKICDEKIKELENYYVH